MTEVISSLKFDELVRSETKPLLIDVYADWCGPCRGIAPSVAALTTDLHGQAKIVKIDRDEADANGGADNALLKFMANEGIRGIPALLLFDGGAYKGVLMGGPRSKENIREWMEETLGRTFDTAPGATPAAHKPKPPGR